MATPVIPDGLDKQLDLIGKKLEILTSKQENTKQWQIVLAVVTALIGFSVWYAQSRIQLRIDDNSRQLEARLALNQEFYRRKLSSYEKVHAQMADLINALNDVRFDPSGKKPAVNALHGLYVSYTTNSIYLSGAIVTQLADLVELGNRLPALDRSGKTTMGQVDQQVALIEEQMKTDLSLAEIGKIPGLESKPARLRFLNSASDQFRTPIEDYESHHFITEPSSFPPSFSICRSSRI